MLGQPVTFYIVVVVMAIISSVCISTGKSQRCRASNNSEVFDVCTWDVSKVTFCDEKSERVFSRRSLARKESESRCCWQEFYGTVHIAKC